MDCRLSNFQGTETELESLKFVQDLESQDIDVLAEDIISTLRQKQSFSVDINTSDNPDEYEDSIKKKLIERILDTLKENKLKFELSNERKAILRRKLLRAFIQPNKTKTDLAVEAIIPSVGMLSQEEISQLKFNEVLVDIFGNNLTILQFGEQEFRSRLHTLSIIDIEHEQIIEGVPTLNDRLERFKGDEYLKLKAFVETIKGENGQQFNSTLIANSYYLNGKMKSNVPNAYNIMYNYIQYLKNNGKLEDAIKDGWELKMRQEPSPFFDALNAYINLQFFDARLKQSFGKYININRDYNEPITEDNGTKVYKYTLATGNSEMTKGWETADYQDAIDQMSGYSQILIENIPLISYDTNDRTRIAKFQRLNAVYFNNAIVNLRSAIMNMPPSYNNQDADLHQMLENTLNNPDEWINILWTIFKSSRSKTIISNLLNSKSVNGYQYLNKFDLNILYSIYKQVFDKSNSKSYISIESKHTSIAGIDGKRYPIISTFYGLMNSTAGMDYLELVYDRKADIPGYKLRVKRKFNSNMTTWDMINAVNRNTYSRTDKAVLVSQYNFKSNETEQVATLDFIQVSSNNVASSTNLEPIAIKFSTHILDKKASVTFEKEFTGIYDKKGNLRIDLSSQSKIRNILENPTQEQQVFLSMLSFIDNMLGTTFSKDEDGLTELREYTNLGGKFSTLLGAAVRALKICEIYDKIEQNPEYQKTEIKRYLNDNPTTYNVPFWTREDLNPYIKKDKRGAFFTVISNYEPWISYLINARMIINGSVSKSVTKNSAGDNIPNYSPTYLGAEITAYLADAESRKDASSNLLFVNPNKRCAIKSVIIDTDVKLQDGTTKAIKDMSESEMLYHAIVDKFHLALTNTRGTVFIQSTTYSDKTKYVGHEISLSDLGINIYSDNVAESSTTQLYNSVGAFYKKIWSNVLDDYEKIFGTRDITTIEYNLNNIREYTKRTYPEIIKENPKLSSEQLFIRLAELAGVTVYKDLHYRPGKSLSINELLYNYGEDLYASIDNLRDRLNIERKQFVNDLIETRTNFYVTRLPDGTINYQDAIGNFISKKGGKSGLNSSWLNGKKDSFEYQWIKGNRLILAKVRDKITGNIRNVEFGKLDIDANEEIILNPFLEAYFSTDVLISNNLRFSLTGSEINHKIKGGGSVIETLGQETSKLLGLSNNTSIVGAMQQLRQIMSNVMDTEERRSLAAKAYITLRDKLIYSREAGGQGAQLKRNVIIPATMRHYLQGQINGVSSRMRIAVIDDVQAVVQNFDGSGCYDRKSKTYGSQTIDAHDGFAFINPIMSILENYSLQDNEVGDMKKNILHGYDHKYGCAVLLKYAAGSMTNAWMRQSEMSPISLRNIFKKMSNERWSKRYADGSIEWLLTDNGEQSGEIDLLESGYKSDATSSLNFEADILKGRKLFYNDKGVTKAISGFSRTGDDYYTIEYSVDPNGDGKEESATKVYHYFDEYGNHITRTEPMSIQDKFEQVVNVDGSISYIEKYHTIDSIYELWLAMGGLESLELVDGVLQDSEASLYATAAFVNYVANKKEGVPDDAEITQENYDQPLKRAFIGYLVNNSAIKNGAGNQNPTSSFYDETPFRTITVDTKGHGVQLDADHYADEATMTEFSQVITSLDAGGRMHNYVKQIYGVLGKVALELSGIEVEAVQAFRDTGNKSKIYDLIGRTIMKNMKEGQKGLLKAIMTEIKKEFNINSDHDLDVFKIPFDDPNIYSQILSTFVSIINRKSIKRKYPGSGMVMMPGYDIETVFDYNGQIYQYQDLVKKAYNTIPQEVKDSIKASNNSDYNKQLVQKLLQIEQEKQIMSSRFDWVNPADRVNIILNDTLVTDVNIETIEDYYRFKGIEQRKYLAEKLYGVKVGKEYDKFWRPKKDGSHLNPDGTVKSNKAFAITLDGVKGYFEIVKDNEDHYWSIHFKTGLQDNNGNFIRDEHGHVLPNPEFTEEQKAIMFQAAALIIPEGDFLSTWGEVTPGGIAGLNRFSKLGFTLTGMRQVMDTNDNEIDVPVFQSNLNLKFQKNVTKSRNLAPVKISWKMPDGTIMNIFDHWSIRQLYETGVRDKAAIQEAFDLLNLVRNGHKGYYWDGKSYDANGNKILVPVTDIVSTEAECVVPNIFQSKFNLTSNQSLVDIRNNPRAFIKPPHLITSDNFDIAFTKNNNRNTYITFKPVQSNSDTFESQISDWDDTIVEDTSDQSTGVIHRVFAVNRDNVKLFEVARKRIISTVVWNPTIGEKGKFTDLDGNVLKDQSKYTRYNDKVLETVTFVQRRRVEETVGNQTNRYTLYNINKEALNEVYIPDGKHSVEDFIGALMSNIYNADDYNGVQLNTTMTTQSANILRKSLNSFAKGQSHNQALYQLIMGDGELLGFRDLLMASKNMTGENSSPTYSIKSAVKKKILGNYFKKLSSEIRASFEKSLYFTASRIPAQSHQSFMQMKAVGFTRDNVTHTFVSHFQTWLQGSDY